MARPTSYGYTRTAYRVMRPFKVIDFSGGLNLQAAPSELADNESPDLLNVTLDERGGVVKRLGYERLGSGEALTGSPSNIFYWSSGECAVVQDGADVKKTTDFVTFSTIKTYTTSARAEFCDFQGKLVAVHPADKVGVYDGATWTDVGTSPKGSCIAVWQNKVWTGGDPDNISRVWASNAGDPTTWDMGASGAFVDIREKDNAPVTALGAGQGMDISGRPGLMVFKKHSWHRINSSDETMGFEYTTLSGIAGAASPLAVTQSTNGLILSISDNGIWASNGVDPPVLASAKIQPLFTSGELNFTQLDKWCAGAYANRVVFCITRGGGQTTNNCMLELHPGLGWITQHNIGFSALTMWLKNDVLLYGTSPTEGKVFQVFKGWSDDGSDITARFQTRWYEPVGGYEMRLRRIRVQGRGMFDLYTKGNYTTGEGLISPFQSASLGMTWGTAVWGEDIWGEPYILENTVDFYSLGHSRSVSWELRETSQTAAWGPSIVSDGSTTEIGSFALYGILLDHVRLGYA